MPEPPTPKLEHGWVTLSAELLTERAYTPMSWRQRLWWRIYHARERWALRLYRMIAGHEPPWDWDD